MKVLLTGGGTGGHLIPLLAVVSELKKMNNVCNKTPQPCGTMGPANDKPEFLLLTSDSEFNKNISDLGIQIKTIKAGKLRRYFSWKNFVDIFKIPIGIIQSLYHIYKFKPAVVFSKGGFASIPPVVAAWILRIPVITHESDIVPGFANKIIARLSSKILVSFSATEKYFDKVRASSRLSPRRSLSIEDCDEKTHDLLQSSSERLQRGGSDKVILTGNPVREDITKGNRESALKFFNLSSDLPTILIFGGSQGAQKINEMVLDILPELIKKYQVIHQCGIKNYDKIKKSVDDLNLENLERYKLYPYLDKEMKDAYAVANLVVSRAGAGSISEIAVLGKPNILIPLSTSASNHQFKNAKFFVEKNASLIIDETVSSANDLLGCISKILADKNLQDEMKNALRDLSSRNSARRIAEEIMKAGNKS